MNYRELTAIGCVNAAFLLVFIAYGIRGKQETWSQAQNQMTQIEARAETEKTNARNQASIAQAYQDANIRPPGSTFTILDYDYNPQMPPTGIDWGRTFDPRQKVQLFDRNQRCIGHVAGGQLHFLGYESTACN